jgi:hypothetical protein
VLFAAMFGNVMLAGFRGMMLRMRRVTMCRMGMMGSGFVAPFLVMLRGLAVMPGRMLMVFGRAMMVFGGRMRVVHLVLFDCWGTRRRLQ